MARWKLLFKESVSILAGEVKKLKVEKQKGAKNVFKEGPRE